MTATVRSAGRTGTAADAEADPEAAGRAVI